MPRQVFHAPFYGQLKLKGRSNALECYALLACLMT